MLQADPSGFLQVRLRKPLPEEQKLGAVRRQQREERGTAKAKDMELTGKREMEQEKRGKLTDKQLTRKTEIERSSEKESHGKRRERLRGAEGKHSELSSWSLSSWRYGLDPCTELCHVHCFQAELTRTLFSGR